MSTQRNSDDRVMEAYYAEVRNSVLLTAEEERELFRHYRTCTRCKRMIGPGAAMPKCPDCGAARNFRARDKLVEGALRFAIKVAKDYARRARGHNFEPDLLQSLISAGNFGLLIAVDRFDPAKGTRFLTYAAWWIREKILEELDHMGIVRVPAYRQKALRAKRKLGGSVELDPAHVTMEELSAVDRKTHDEQLERNLVNTYGTELIYQSLDDLEIRGRDKYIIVAYFGVREDPKNLRQISNRLDLSSERVRQIKKTVLEQLKSHLESLNVAETEDVFSE